MLTLGQENEPYGSTFYALGFIALPLLVGAGAAFLILEIVIRKRFSVIVIFILAASFLQIHTDLLNSGQAARLYSLDTFSLSYFFAKNKRSLLFILISL